MAVLEADDIFELILTRLDVLDLIRCKYVCKSWHSLISDTRFIEKHLNHSSNNHRDVGIANRRIVVTRKPISLFEFNFGDWFLNLKGNYHLLGSSNGLICIFNPNSAQLLVTNPLTRDTIRLKTPVIPNPTTSDLCWGFGYDSSVSDYKVVVGFMKSDQDNSTCFQVLNLKTNVWRNLGEVKFVFITSVATLCNGSFHWFANGLNDKKVILSFNLSREEFVEIPQPDHDPAYRTCILLCDGPCLNISLGTMKECLCIFYHDMLPENLWVMNAYNVKRSWEKAGPDCEIKYEAIHYLREVGQGVPFDEFLCHDVLIRKTLGFIGAPVFVQSLVSPRVHDCKR